MKVSEVMTRGVISLAPGDPVLKAAQRMLQYGVSGFPVLDHGRLVGIITQGDFLRRAELGTEQPRTPARRASIGELADEYAHAHGRMVGEVMTRNVATVTEETPLEAAVDLMQRYRVKRLPVMKGDVLVGLVSRANLLHAFITNSSETGPGPAIDAEIREALSAALDDEPWAPLGSIRIEVDRGQVDLRGIISDERQRLALRVAAENTKGVTEVCDHLALSHAGEDASDPGRAGKPSPVDAWILQANISRYRSVLASGALSEFEARSVEKMLADAEGSLRGGS